MAGKSAAPEILIICPAPVSCLEAGFHILLPHIPEGFHTALSLLIFRGAASVQGGGPRVDQDKAVLRYPVRFYARHPLAGPGAPIGAHIMKAGSRVGNQGAQHHGNAV